MVDVKGKRVFLSGPMTGMEHYNALEFIGAHLALLDAGALAVYNPAVKWLDETAKDPEERREDHGECMMACLHELTSLVRRYDVLVRLPGWEDSLGATFETACANACGMPAADLGEVLS